MSNKNLHKAQYVKNDEFYTQLPDIEKEIPHYDLSGKSILCNCNDSLSSSFTKYFIHNFEQLRIKQLITVSELYILRYYDKNKYYTTKSYHNGDFRENTKLLNEADVIITNPPFSLFREYIKQLLQNNKKFLIIGNKNAVKYPEIFPYIKNNLLWLGYSSPNKFNTPEGETNKLQGLCRWFTNLPVKSKHLPNTGIRFKDMEYDTYDNIPNIIKVNKIKEIPMDYDNYMAVPITYLDYYNPNEYEIIDMLNYKTVLDYFDVNKLVKNNNNHCCTVNGKSTFSRIVIKKIA